MKQTITYACGHEGVAEFYGKEKERERKLRWLETQCLCPDCLKAENHRKSQEAQKEAEALHLPPLVGTPKQTEWALAIRASKLREARSVYLREDLPEELREKAHQFYDWYASQNWAYWWIDHRYDSPKAICQMLRPLWEYRS